MKTLIHYIKCIISIILLVLKKSFKKLCKGFIVPFRFLIAAILLKTGKSLPSKKYDLCDYYPDKGKLSDTLGYRHSGTKYDLTVIIPMYNVEQYVNDCIDSILNQETDYSYEIILVDDGSTDGTISKTERYLNKHNIQLIKQENSGQSVARNKALYESLGKYVMFVDSDDVLLQGAINNLMDAALKESADIAEGEFIRFYDGSKITEETVNAARKKTHIESYKNNPRFILSCVGYSVAKVYRREIFENVRFPERYIFEDTITKYILRRVANKVVFTGEAVYAYRINSSSSTHSGFTPKLLDCIWIFGRYIELCRQQNLAFDETIYTMALSSLALNVVIMKIEDKELKISCFYELCKNADLIEKYKIGSLPLALKISEKALKTRNMRVWEYMAKTVFKYNLLKKYREA